MTSTAESSASWAPLHARPLGRGRGQVLPSSKRARTELPALPDFAITATAAAAWSAEQSSREVARSLCCGPSRDRLGAATCERLLDMMALILQHQAPEACPSCWSCAGRRSWLARCGGLLKSSSTKVPHQLGGPEPPRGRCRPLRRRPRARGRVRVRRPREPAAQRADRRPARVRVRAHLCSWTWTPTTFWLRLRLAPCPRRRLSPVPRRTAAAVSAPAWRMLSTWRRRLLRRRRRRRRRLRCVADQGALGAGTTRLIAPLIRSDCCFW